MLLYIISIACVALILLGVYGVFSKSVLENSQVQITKATRLIWRSTSVLKEKDGVLRDFVRTSRKLHIKAPTKNWNDTRMGVLDDYLWQPVKAETIPVVRRRDYKARQGAGLGDASLAHACTEQLSQLVRHVGEEAEIEEALLSGLRQVEECNPAEEGALVQALTKVFRDADAEDSKTAGLLRALQYRLAEEGSACLRHRFVKNGMDKRFPLRAGAPELLSASIDFSSIHSGSREGDSGEVVMLLEWEERSQKDGAEAFAIIWQHEVRVDNLVSVVSVANSKIAQVVVDDKMSEDTLVKLRIGLGASVAI